MTNVHSVNFKNKYTYIIPKMYMTKKSCITTNTNFGYIVPVSGARGKAITFLRLIESKLFVIKTIALVQTIFIKFL